MLGLDGLERLEFELHLPDRHVVFAVAGLQLLEEMLDTEKVSGHVSLLKQKQDRRRVDQDAAFLITSGMGAEYGGFSVRRIEATCINGNDTLAVVRPFGAGPRSPRRRDDQQQRSQAAQHLRVGEMGQRRQHRQS
jgi:hypothetical protein